MTPAISSFIAPVAPALPVNAPAAPPQHNEFAQMLGQRQAMAREQTAHAAERQAADKAATPKAHSEAAPTAPKAPAAERQAARADKPKAPAAQAAQHAQAGADAPAADKAAATDDDPVDPALAEWLAALNLPSPTSPTLAPEAPAAGGKARQGAEAQSAELDQGLSLGKGAHPAGKGEPADVAQAVERGGRAAREVADIHQRAAQPAAEARSETAWQALAEQIAAPHEAPLRPETPAVGAGGFAAHMPTTGRTGEPAPATVVHVPTPATAPEFTQSLGVQISVLARDGVQQAELHLNPAEMGPISVQIALDGTQAQVNFGADSAATRQIIEGGLPELAAALRDAGFTLSGGGVHSQSQGRGEGGGSNASSGFGRNGSSSSETEVTPRRVNARVSAGGVDLYA